MGNRAGLKKWRNFEAAIRGYLAPGLSSLSDIINAGVSFLRLAEPRKPRSVIPLALELDHGRVRRHHSQPQRRERLQEPGFLHGERVLLLRDLGEPALGGAIFHIKRDNT